MGGKVKWCICSIPSWNAFPFLITTHTAMVQPVTCNLSSVCSLTYACAVTCTDSVLYQLNFKAFFIQLTYWTRLFFTSFPWQLHCFLVQLPQNVIAKITLFRPWFWVQPSSLNISSLSACLQSEGSASSLCLSLLWYLHPVYDASSVWCHALWLISCFIQMCMVIAIYKHIESCFTAVLQTPLHKHATSPPLWEGWCYKSDEPGCFTIFVSFYACLQFSFLSCSLWSGPSLCSESVCHWAWWCRRCTEHECSSVSQVSHQLN